MTDVAFPSQAEASGELPVPGGWLVTNQMREVLALADTHAEAEEWRQTALRWYEDAHASAHPKAGAFLNAREPVVVRTVTREEREQLEALGTPELQREP